MTIEIDENDSESDGGVTIRTSKRRKASRKDIPAEESSAVENDEPIPLFPHLDKNIENIVSSIRVYKRDPPGEGYKGDVHPTASLDFVAKRWGNGIYDFQALNSAHQILRRNDNIVISSRPNSDSRLSSDSMAERLLERQTATYERDQNRQQELAKEAISLSRTQAASYAEMIRADTIARTERDREFFSQQMAAARESSNQTLQHMRQMHQMEMEQTRAMHQQQMQLLMAMQERESAQNNPLLLISVLEKGMQLGMSSGGDVDPLSVAMQTGLGGLQELTKMMALQKENKAPKLRSANPSGARRPKKRIGISRSELGEILALKRLAESKGYDFEGIVSQAKTIITAAPPNPEDSTDDDESSESDDRDDTSESGETDLDN